MQVCDRCHITFRDNASLNSHKCIVMSSQVNNNYNELIKQDPPIELRETKEPKEEEDLKQCDLCNQFYKNQVYFDEHLARDHKKPEEKHPCRNCGVSFDSNALLVQHQQSHHNASSSVQTSLRTSEGRYICDICNKTYRSRSILRTHRITHGTTKPFTCEFCQQGFNSFSNLKNHRYKHTGQKFPCDHCGKTYSSPGNLKTHISKLHSHDNIS